MANSALPAHNPSSAPERWLPVVDWEGLYEVSDQGRVRSLDREFMTPTGGFAVRRGVILSQRTAAGDYVHVQLSGHSRLLTIRVHRLVLTAFVGPCPAQMEALHGNGNREDNRLANLRWGTRSENQYDAVRHAKERKALERASR